MSDINPYDAPDAQEIAEEALRTGPYGGIGRAAYFGISFLIGVVNNVLQAVAISAGVPEVVFVLAILGLIISVVLVVQRLKNMGYSGWWVLGFIVPILNIVVALRCLAAPEGYADHKTLDSAGKIILGIFGVMFVLVIVMIIVASQM